MWNQVSALALQQLWMKKDNHVTSLVKLLVHTLSIYQMEIWSYAETSVTRTGFMFGIMFSVEFSRALVPPPPCAQFKNTQLSDNLQLGERCGVKVGHLTQG